MRTIKTLCLALLVSVVALHAGALHAAENEGEGVALAVGMRTWFATWEAGDVDVGEGSLQSLYVHLLYRRLSASLLLGAGEGWSIPSGDGDIAVDQRLDLLVSVAYEVANMENVALYAGAAYHYFGYETDGGEVDYFGPAITGSIYVPLMATSETALDLRVSGYYYPWLLYNGKSFDLATGDEGASIENADTTGYQAEAALELTRGGAWQAQLGYRAIVIEDGMDSDTKALFAAAGGDVTSEDLIHGVFAQLSVMW
ncbi:MAG: hypothetical protein HN919_22690 [Verrucomicrobia bacterium]|nr:hypothetical protein [Verrucomicrobiota bacterium]MBT7069121.1 hypothetical protein [Verrucomicrobiota bacterium]MBT7699461.1 hypothetical protein [Verrucomicrobiota bacterium]